MRKLSRTFLAVFLATTPTFAAPTPRDRVAAHPNQVRGDEITPEQQRAVERGLEWLAKQQRPDGSFGSEGMSPNAAITALAGLATITEISCQTI